MRGMLLMGLYAAITVVGCAKGTPTDSTSAEPETPSLGEATDLPTNGPPLDTVSAAAEVTLVLADWEAIQQEVAQHTGKVVVLDLWSTSCPPCLREFPNLVALQAKYPEKVVCLSCSTDYLGIKSKPPEYYAEQVKTFLTEQRATFTNYLCTVPSEDLYGQLDLASIPAVIVYNPDGTQAERFDNDEGRFGDEFTYADHVIPLIEKLLIDSPSAK